MRRSGTSVFSRALRTKRDWHVLAAWAPRLEQGSRYPLTPPVASLRLCPKRNRDILNSDYYHSTMVWMVSWRSLDPSFLSVWREIRSVQTMASPSGHLLPAVLRSTWAIWFARPWTYFASREVAEESMSSSWRRCSVSETDLIRDSQRHRHRPSWKPFQMLLQRKISWPPITRWSFLLALCLHFPTTGQTVGMSCRCHVKCSLSRSLGLAHGQVPSLRKHLLRIHTPGYFGP